MKNRTWLKEYRLNQELTQQQVANMIGISLRFYQMIEQGVKNPSPLNAARIGSLLDFNPMKFFVGEENEEA